MQTLKKTHWLEIAEYLSLLATFIAIVVAYFSKLWVFPLGLLLLSLGLNLINRWRIQVLLRKRMSAIARQLQRQWQDEIQSINLVNPSSSLSASVQPLDESALEIVSDSLNSIEQSIKTIIQYLNTHNLPDRVARLESLNQQIQTEMSQVTDKAFPAFSALSVPIPSWQPLYTLTDHHDAVSCVTLTPEGNHLISGSWDQTVKVWEVENGSLKMSFKAHNQGIMALSVVKTESEQILATGSFDQSINLWLMNDLRDNLDEFGLIKRLTAHTGSIHALATLDTVLISGSYDQTIKQWDLTTREMITSSLDGSGAIYAVAVSQNEKFIASAGGDGQISLWMLETGKLLGYLTGNLSSVESLAISPDGKTITAGCVDGKIKIWYFDAKNQINSSKNNLIGQLNAHQGPVKTLYFSPDGELLYSGGADGYIHIWHFSDNKPLSTFKINEDEESRLSAIVCLILSLDGNYLIAGNSQGMIQVWGQK